MISKAVKGETLMFAPKKLQKTIACYLRYLQHPGCATCNIVSCGLCEGNVPPIIRQLMTYCDQCQKGKKMKQIMCSTAAKDRAVINPWHTVCVDPPVVVGIRSHYNIGIPLQTWSCCFIASRRRYGSQKALKVMPWPNISTIMISLAVG